MLLPEIAKNQDLSYINFGISNGSVYKKKKRAEKFLIQLRIKNKSKRV